MAALVRNALRLRQITSARAAVLTVTVALAGTGSAPGAAAATPPTFVADSMVVEVPEGTLATLHGTYSDPDGDAVTLTASTGDISKDFLGNTGRWRWSTPAHDGPHESVVTLTATDSTGASTSLGITFRIVNRPPEAWLRGPAFVPSRSNVSRLFWYSATDVPGDEISPAVDCGTGTQVDDGPTSTASVRFVRCWFAPTGATDVSLHADDGDGGVVDVRAATVVTPRVTSMGDADLIIGGALDEHYMGGRLAVGDFNGDGRDDIAIGSGVDIGLPASDPNRVEVVFGRTGRAILDLAAMPDGAGARITGSVGDVVGRALGAADINGDGLDDLLVGAPGRGDAKGSVFALFGSKDFDDVDVNDLGPERGFEIIGDGNSRPIGNDVARVGDTNGDGFEDFAVSRRADGSSEFVTTVVLGRASPTTLDLAAMPAGRGFRILSVGERLGSAFGAGDVNGDGKADVVAASYFGWNSRAVVVYGRATPVDVNPATMPASAGFTIGGSEGLQIRAAAVGDMDGDGRAEVAIGHGAAHLTELRTAVSIVRGGATNASIEYLSTAPSNRVARITGNDEGLGTALAMTDRNRDGRADLVVGAWGARHNDDHSGSAYIVHGATTLAAIDVTVLDPRWIRIDGDQGYSLAGAAVAGGDLNGDGVGDVILGAPGATNWRPMDRGQVSVAWGSVPDTTAPRATAPSASVLLRGAVTGGRAPIKLTWSGSDTGSGVARYELARSTNGGSWVTVPTPARAVTTMTVGLPTGASYRFRVRAVDRASNRSAWAYGPTFTVRAYSEASTAVRWTGLWATASDPGYWGGKARHASARGATASITVIGRAVAWVGAVGPGNGVARVYVNGTLVATVDLRSSSWRPGTVVFSRTWSASTTRTVRIVVNGTVGRPRVDFDGLIVLR